LNIICDLDGTIALDYKRNHFLHADRCPKNKSTDHTLTCICMPYERRWTEYFDACDTDVPCRGVIELLQSMAANHTIWILSGRSMSAHEKTLSWLEKYYVPYHKLQMRGQDDRTDDTTLKIKWAEIFDLEPYNTLFVLEDRTRVVDAWRAKGFRCFQVAPGNF
jgi:uncharacterized HAD superfamily protein